MTLCVVRGIYKHYKGGTYKVMYIAKHTETEECLVVYRNLNSKLKHDIWARPLDMFLSNVKTTIGYIPRLGLVNHQKRCK